jgi:hypothetical protein
MTKATFVKEVLLSDLEKKRLADEKLNPDQRKQNTYRVKQKLRAWADSSDDIIYALDRLSPKVAANVFDEKDIYRLLDIALAIAKKRDFAPIYETKFGHIAIRNSISIFSKKATIDEDGIRMDDSLEDWIRPAWENEGIRNWQLYERTFQLLDLVLGAESMSLLDDIRNHFPREGYAESRLKGVLDDYSTMKKLKSSKQLSKIKLESKDVEI